MSESAVTQIASLEDLLRGLANLPAAPCRSADTLHDESDFGRRSLLAAVVALTIFVPGCAASAMFLLQADDAIALPVRVPADEPLLAKSDRLPPFTRGPAPAHGYNSEILMMGEITPMSALHMPRDVAVLDPAAIRGSLDDAPATIMVGSTASRDAMAEMTASTPPKQKSKRRLAHAKPLKLVAEVTPDPEPPSLLQRLFGHLSL